MVGVGFCVSGWFCDYDCFLFWKFVMSLFVVLFVFDFVVINVGVVWLLESWCGKIVL